MLIRTFLENHNLNGKTVIPFCTSAGSGISGSMASIRSSAKGAEVVNGRDLTDDSQAQVRSWIGCVMSDDVQAEQPSSGNGSSTSDTNGNTAGSGGPENNTNTDSTGKLLVAYFSWSGTSEKQAQAIAAQTGADMYRIERQTPYSSDYNTVAYGEAKDEADANARPPLRNTPPSLDAYEKVVLCYPIWLAYHNLIQCTQA